MITFFNPIENCDTSIAQVSPITRNLQSILSNTSPQTPKSKMLNTWNLENRNLKVRIYLKFFVSNEAYASGDHLQLSLSLPHFFMFHARFSSYFFTFLRLNFINLFNFSYIFANLNSFAFN